MDAISSTGVTLTSTWISPAEAVIIGVPSLTPSRSWAMTGDTDAASLHKILIIEIPPSR